MGNIPDKESLYFIDIEVDILPQNFTDQFQKCIHTHFYGGSVKTIHISPKLSQIELNFTSTEHVIIEHGKYYQLESFKCSHAKLTRIPENISQLKKMKRLELNDNQIQTVLLDQLNGLDNLETLDLFSNKIKHIYNHGSVSLPSLTSLSLEHNRLKHIDVCSWNMTSLFDLNLVDNELTHFAINHFRKLKRLNITENPLNCAWAHSLLKGRTDLTVQRGFTCDRKSESVYGLDCPSTVDQLRQQISTQIAEKSQTIDHLKQQNSKFRTRLDQIERKVLNKDLSNRVQKLETAMNKRFQKVEALLENLNSKTADHLKQQISTFDSRLAQIEGTALNNSQQIAEINNTLQKMEQLLVHVSKQVVEQHNVSNDIIEAIYRAEIERTYSTNKSP
ncbi:leucine-rich repeat-containing protein 49-like isoform X2 [Aedes albopictus]